MSEASDAQGEVATFLTHYFCGRPFQSLMALTPAERAEVLAAGHVPNAARYADPDYVRTRQRVEDELRTGFEARGGRAQVRFPFYALLGRSQAVERRSPERVGVQLALAAVPGDAASFTFFDSFCLDPQFRRARGIEHPAVGEVHLLTELNSQLERWAGIPWSRPLWMEIEVQLWFRPDGFTWPEPSAS